jgi:biopolymer transport protein ExbD
VNKIIVLMIIILLIIGAVALNKIINSPDTESTTPTDHQNQPLTTTNTNENYTNNDTNSNPPNVPTTKVLQK